MSRKPNKCHIRPQESLAIYDLRFTIYDLRFTIYDLRSQP